MMYIKDLYRLRHGTLDGLGEAIGSGSIVSTLDW